MGQKSALFYKYWILTKRQKAGFCCQIFSPLFGIALISLILSNMEGISGGNLPGMFDSEVLPSSIYFSNLITPKWNEVWQEFFDIGNNIRINRFAFQKPGMEEEFQAWIDSQSSVHQYDGEEENGNYTVYPKWLKSDSDSIQKINDQLIKEVKILNELDKNELQSSLDLPDSATFIRGIDDEKGIDAHFMTNNIAFVRYHRMNGQTFARTLATGDLGSTGSPVFSTEAGVAQINMINNMHIQSIFQNDFINVISLVSATVDASLLEDLIQSVIAIACNLMFPISFCLGFPLMLFVLVMEKQEKIKDLLEINGLNNFNYWFTFFAYYFIILQTTMIVWLILGVQKINIPFFQETSTLLHLWILTVWNLSQMGFTLFFSSFLKESRMATLVGYQGSIFLILFLCIISQFLFPNPSHLPIVFYLLPQTALVRYIYLCISKCIDIKCYQSTADIKGEMATVFISMHVCFVLYTAIGLMLNEPYIARYIDLNKFLSKFKSKPKSSDSDDSFDGFNDYNRVDDEEFQEKHSSAIEYEKKIQNVDFEDSDYMLLAKGLSKSFPCSQGVKKALTKFSIGIKRDQIFGLLGPNGAGKTTFLSIVTGMARPDEGEGWICSNSIKEKGIHAGNIGFCPQFDVLWPLLNVEEHLVFMGMFKGAKKSEINEQVMQLIEEVDLEKDYKKMAQQLSGGMKRRCSMAMALTGDPRIIFLDEPSSGLDPVKRRHFWQLIQKVTKDRAVLLTTHLMEEADTLCDEIGIITTGKLRCIGNSLSLKSTFAEGMKLQIVMNQENRRQEKIDYFMEQLKSQIEGIKLEGSFRGTLSLVVKQKGMKLSYLFEVITKMIENRISDWSVSLGSLEDVFLRVVSKYRETNVFAVEK